MGCQWTPRVRGITYYKLEFLTNDRILRTLYVSKPQIFLQESMTIKIIFYLRTKIYLMVITLDLNLVNNNIEEAYNQEEDLNEIFYYNLNNIESPNIENNEDD